ncbi:MAG: DUF5110 domain-containing protein [Ruminococcaceae bacterium]|nr:DUF5110 domain-containing protein [Oscillospiraceae bacterium]
MMIVDVRKSNRILSHSCEADGLHLRTEAGGVLRLSPKRENILRVSYTQREALSDKTGLGFVTDETVTGWTVEETDDSIALVLPGLRAVVSREYASIRYFDGEGRLLLAERERESRELESFDAVKTVIDENTQVEEIATADGVKRVIRQASTVFDRKLYHTWLHLQFAKGEQIYGLGQSDDGAFALRGTTQYVHQANMKIAVPFFVSTRGYGLLSGTDSTAIFSDGDEGTYFYTEADEQQDFYFIAGGNLDGVIAGYRFLTGRAVMLPRWAFGYVQSQERFESQEELVAVTKEYRRRGLGLDCIVLDWWSWIDGQWGQKTLDPARFPDPDAMTRDLHDLNARLMVSIWPNMAEGTANNDEFAEVGLLLPASDIYNVYDPAARALYWKQAKAGLFDHGVDAWWCDSSEPFTPEWGHKVKPPKAVAYAEFVRDASKAVPSDITNAYGLVHASTMYEGQRSATEEKRVCNLTRSTFTGGQRYGTVLWSGDTAASWSTLRNQIAEGLSFSASGLPYWTMDIGAFFVKKGPSWFWNGDYPEGLDDLGFRELYVRWFQLGAFLPMFRSHGTDVRREMWHYGDEGDPFYEALAAANRLRYRLLPYIYSWAGKVWREDGTMLRLLAFDFAHDSRVYEIADEYMLGQSLLVCPITEPFYYEAGSRPITPERYGREVYLPAGCDWVDFHSDRVYAGGQTIFAEAPMDRIPLFVRAGSILPMASGLTCADQLDEAELELHVYPGADASFSYYEDAGDGYGYEQGEYRVTEFRWDDKSGTLTVDKDNDRAFTLIQH